MPRRETAAVSSPVQRIRFIDMARGSAMFFVLLSHFGFGFFLNQKDAVPTAMRLIGMVASPTFIIISGTLVGFLYRVRGADFERIRIKLFDRGLFLLTIGHLLILGSHAPTYTTHFLSITDTVGVCMLVGPWLMVRMRPRSRLLLAAATYTVAWFFVYALHPAGRAGMLVKETLFGSFQPPLYTYAFPLLPWFAVDFASTVLGDRLAVFHLRGDVAAMKRLLAGLGALGLTSVALSKIGLYLSVPFLTAHQSAAIRSLVAVHAKQPPGPMYLLFYGSIGMWILAGWLTIEHSRLVPAISRRIAALGETSLFVFVLQFYIYIPVFALVRRYVPVAGWPVYFVLSVLLIAAAALEWHRRGYNRLITIGYYQLATAPARSAGMPKQPVPIEAR